MKLEDRQKMLAEIANETKKLALPVDFDELEKKGVLSKEGAWFRVHDYNRLPEHARAKIKELRQDQKGIRVKFSKSSDFDKLAKKFAKLGL